MLRRDDDRVRANGLSVPVLQRDLGFSVGTEIRDGPLLAHLREPSCEPMCEGDGHRQEFGRLVARVADHHSLVSGARLRDFLFVGRLVPDFERRVHALGDIGRLFVDRGDDRAGIAVEAVLRARVPYFLDDIPGELRDIDVSVCRYLARDKHESGRHEHLARHAPLRVVLEDRVEDAVRNLIGHLVGMALRHGFRSKQKLFRHMS